MINIRHRQSPTAPLVGNTDGWIEQHSPLQGQYDQDQIELRSRNLTHLTKETGCLKFDDRLDSLEMMVRHIQEHLGLDMDDAIEGHKGL